MGAAVIRLPQKAVAGAMFGINIAFYDAAGTAMTPNSVGWGCYTSDGTTVNSLSGQSETPANSVNIVLNATDTMVISGQTDKRVVRLECSYDSVTYGNGLILKNDIEFDLDRTSDS